MFEPEMTLRVAENVFEILKRRRVDAVVIGATALAAYQYVRQLVALKLYAGGHKSKADIIELLRRNPHIYSEVKEVCGRYRLPGLDELIEEASDLGSA